MQQVGGYRRSRRVVKRVVKRRDVSFLSAIVREEECPKKCLQEAFMRAEACPRICKVMEKETKRR